MTLNHEYTAEQKRRWEAWQHAGAVAARRSDRIVRVVGATMFLVLLTGVWVAMMRL